MIFALVLGCFAGAAAEAKPTIKLDLDGGKIVGVDEPYTTILTPEGYLKIGNVIAGNFHDSLEDETLTSFNVTKPGYSFHGWLNETYGASDTYNSKKIVFDAKGHIKDGVSEYAIISESDGNYNWNTTLVEITLKAYWVEREPLCLYFYQEDEKDVLEDEEIQHDILGHIYFEDSGYLFNKNVEGDTNHPIPNPEKTGHKFLGWKIVGGDLLLFKPYVNGESTLQFAAENIAGYVVNNKWLPSEESLCKKYSNTDGIALCPLWEEIDNSVPEQTGGSSAIILIGSKSSSSGSGPHIEHKYVTFDANGGLGEMEKQQFTGGQTKALTANQFTFAGKNFAGWALEPTGMVTYSDGQEIMVEEDLTLYAVWVEPIPENPDVGGDGEDETGIPTWLAVLLVAVVLAILIAVLVYFLVIRRGAA